MTTIVQAILYIWCSVCGRETAHVFLGESHGAETYRCRVCGNQKAYTVR